MNKKRNMITAAMLAASMLLTACSGGGESTAPESSNDTQPEASAPAGTKDSLTVAIQSDPSGLDPHMVTDRAAGIAIENLYNTLFTYTDKYGEAVPSLAKSYEVSEDGLTYTLQLQEGVLFHSGNPMTSEDVKYSLERIKDSGARASQVEKISSIETPDENTVVIQLESEYAPFLTYLANPLNAIVEKAVAEENDGNLTNADAGTGPFKLVKWNEGSSVDMEAHYKLAPEASGFILSSELDRLSAEGFLRMENGIALESSVVPIQVSKSLGHGESGFIINSSVDGTLKISFLGSDIQSGIVLLLHHHLFFCL